MTKMLTIDDDLAVLLDQEASRCGEPLDRAINRLLRSSLRTTPSSRVVEPFRVRGSKDLGLPQEWTSGKTEDLVDLLEGPDRKW